MQASLASIDSQIAQLSDQTEIQRQAAQMQADARAEANTYYQWIEAQGAQQYNLLQKQLADQITSNQNALAIAQGQMDLLTQGLGYDQFMAARQAEMVAVLGQIRDVLVGIYQGGGKTATVQAQSKITVTDIQPLIPYIKRQLKTA